MKHIKAVLLDTKKYLLGESPFYNERTDTFSWVDIIPAEHVTSCYFYGEKNETLFITSSGDGLSGEFDGCLFTCEVKKINK